jgi:hypothetical protein
MYVFVLYFLFLNIFFMYNTLFTDKISNILLTIDVVFSVFLEHCKIWMCGQW